MKNAGSSFYKHFSQGKSTDLGRFIVKSTAKKIFEFCKINKGASLLEIGPGRGAFAEVCHENGVKYTAIEASKDMSDSLNSRGFKVLYGKVPPLPKIEDRFDAVVMIHVMEHMDTMGQALELSQDVFNILKPDGKFVISSPDFVNWKYLFFPGDFSHNYVTSQKRLESLLLSSGFENTKSSYLSGPISGLPCFLISGIAARIQLQILYAIFPKSNVIHKLLKIQATFLRSILISGTKCSC